MVVLFDGDCGFCNRSVEFIWKHDPGGRFWFAPLESAAARGLLDEIGVAAPDPESMCLVAGETVYQRGEAVRRICAELELCGPVKWISRVLPVVVLDAGYRVVARLRRRLGGECCAVPPDEVRRRFL